jgi:Uncharacterized protein conserved in bacteria (DUF2188)
VTGDVNIREVIPVGDGTWRVLEPGCKRASAVTDTREEAEERARTILRNVGGGEVRVRAADGSVVAVLAVPAPDESSRRGPRIYRSPRGSYGIG